MTFRALADATMAVHFAFIVFVVLGGLLVLRWRWVMWLHLPAAVWGVLIELRGWTCPLTPLENHYRRQYGASGYSGGFIDHYLEPLIYPPGLGDSMRFALAAFVLLVNAVVYWFVFRRPARQSSTPGPLRSR